MARKNKLTLVNIIVVILLVAMTMTGCTENSRTRRWGGDSTIALPRGQRLVEMTWKDSNLWILTEPMDSDYIPKTKTFYESSQWGVLEGSITIVENR